MPAAVLPCTLQGLHSYSQKKCTSVLTLRDYLQTIATNITVCPTGPVTMFERTNTRMTLVCILLLAMHFICFAHCVVVEEPPSIPVEDEPIALPLPVQARVADQAPSATSLTPSPTRSDVTSTLDTATSPRSPSTRPSLTNVAGQSLGQKDRVSRCTAIRVWPPSRWSHGLSR